MQPYFQKLPDGSILIEWVSPDARFCINIEPKVEESGWCYVTKDYSHLDSGLLPPEFLRLLTKRAADLCPACRHENTLDWDIRLK